MNLTDSNEIRALLTRHGFRFSKSLGQNFLTAAWVPERIADEAGLDGSVGALEVGPGIGCLTEQLSRRAAKVLSVELDRSLRPVLAETLTGCENVEVLFGDVLKQDLPALVRESFPGLTPVVCANLPYNVTTPVLTALIEAGCFARITVMIQREVARRICASPGTPDYGALLLRAAAEGDLFGHPPHPAGKAARGRLGRGAAVPGDPRRLQPAPQDARQRLERRFGRANQRAGGKSADFLWI